MNKSTTHISTIKSISALIGLIAVFCITVGSIFDYHLRQMNLAGGSGSSTAQHMEQTNPDTLFFSFYRNGTDFCELTTCEGDDAEVHSGSYNVEHRVTGAYRISGDTIILDAVLSGDHMHGLSFLVRANRVLFVPNSANFFALEPSMLIQVNRLTGMNLNKLNSKKSDNQIK